VCSQILADHFLIVAFVVYCGAFGFGWIQPSMTLLVRRSLPRVAFWTTTADAGADATPTEFRALLSSTCNFRNASCLARCAERPKLLLNSLKLAAPLPTHALLPDLFAVTSLGDALQVHGEVGRGPGEDAIGRRHRDNGRPNTKLMLSANGIDIVGRLQRVTSANTLLRTAYSPGSISRYG